MLTKLIATYRLQLHARFGFDRAAALLDYLAELGVSHVYASPYLQAAAGSMHGYDVVNPRRVNPELGGEEGHERFCRALAEKKLGQVLDIVPNHMAIGYDNPWWRDLLEFGPASPYASYFDIDWNPLEPRLKNKILLPVLGDHYGKVLEAGEIQLEREGGTFSFRYYDHRFPAAAGSLAELLTRSARASGSDILDWMAGLFGSLPAPGGVAGAQAYREQKGLLELFSEMCRTRPEVGGALDRTVSEFNADPDLLDEMLGRQHYRPAYWRTAQRDLNYRRFFDIHTLAGVRVEEEDVFAGTHELILRWLKEGLLDGLRVDHPDGLADPEGYFARLREAAPEAWIVAEKILHPDERLPESWPVAGTTGYDFMNRVAGLFVDPGGEEALTQFYADFTGEPADFERLVREKKCLILRKVLGSELNRLADLFMAVCERRRRYRDFSREEVREVLLEALAGFSVYRAYVRPGEQPATAADEARIGEALAAAALHNPDLDPELLEFLRKVLLFEFEGESERRFVVVFQQTTGPVMAKSVEDTSFYCYNRLISLNEVGGAPDLFGWTVERFHQACLETQERRPRSMLATSTHDNKRSEDVRLRIHLLSEIPERWSAAVRRWAARNARYQENGAPDRNTEYFFYQTLIGAWPIEPPRIQACMLKSIREAKTFTSWTEPNPVFEKGVERFVESVLTDAEFVADFQSFLAPLIPVWQVSSLSHTLIKLTAPGVPDIYQGTELWDLSLVDPDNRRPVDYELRRGLLRELDRRSPEEIMARMDEGAPKLWVIRQGLRLRQRLPEAFGANGSYDPMPVRGSKEKHAVAFSRGGQVAVIGPRLAAGLGGDWEETTVELPEGDWTNELTGENTPGGTMRIGELLKRFPAALLSRKEAMR